MLTTFKVNRAISSVFSGKPGTTEYRLALQKLRKMGVPAVKHLTQLFATTDRPQLVEALLSGFLNNNTLDTFLFGLTDPDPKVSAGVLRVLKNNKDFDAGKLLEKFGQSDIPKSLLAEILESRAADIHSNQILIQLDKVNASSRPLLYRLLSKVVSKDSLEGILDKTTSKDPLVRAQMANLLSRFDNIASINKLQHLLEDSNKNVRITVLQSLAQLNAQSAVGAICRSLKDPDLLVQTTAIDTIVKINADNTVKHLITVLQDESEYVRRAAVEVLNVIGDERAIKDLLNALRDADWWVKVRAADALGTIGGPRVIDAVLVLIKDEDEFLRRTAVEIINTSKDPRTFSQLVAALEDEDWWVRERAADALAALGDKRAVEPLINMLNVHPEASQVVVRALSTLGDKRAITPLLKHLSSQGESTQREILDALSKLTDDQHAETVHSKISEMLPNATQEIRALANDTIATIKQRFGTEHVETQEIGHLDLDALSGPRREQGTPVKPRVSSAASSQENNIAINANMLKPGEIFADRYKIIKQVGKGGFGVVTLVEDLMVNDQFILKFLNPNVSVEDNMIRRFTHELRYARKVTHENVIRIYDFVKYGATYAISMEYFESHSLAYELAKDKVIGVDRAIQLLQKICSGMSAAQQVNVVHRDLKPSNILINDKNEIKIVDFGLAAAARCTDSRLTKTGILVGTPTYMAPEQIRGDTIDSRTDIYSLGIIMYEMLTGRAPYTGEGALGVMFQHTEGKAKPLRQLNPTIPTSLEKVVLKAIAVDPKQRQQNFSELGLELFQLTEEFA